MTLSQLLEAMCFPSGENATKLTLMPCRISASLIGSPVSASHIRTVTFLLSYHHLLGLSHPDEQRKNKEMAEPSDGDSSSDSERPTQRPTRRRAAADTGPVEVMDSQFPTLPTDKTKAAERPAAGKSRRAFVTMLPDEPFSEALTFVSNIPPEGSI